MTCHNAVLEAWPEAPFAQRLKETPRNYDTLSEIPCLSCLIPLTYYHVVIGEVVSHIMPLLMNVLRNATGGGEHRKLRWKAMECAGLIGTCVIRQRKKPLTLP